MWCARADLASLWSFNQVVWRRPLAFEWAVPTRPSARSGLPFVIVNYPGGTENAQIMTTGLIVKVSVGTRGNDNHNINRLGDPRGYCFLLIQGV
ncbi:hypothetical protein ES705_33464 [subsurface metagenome]